MSNNSSILNNSVWHKYTVSVLQTAPFQTIQFSICTQFQYQKTVLFATIQFSICTLFSSIWPLYRTLSDATTPCKSGPGSDGNKEVLRISKSSSTNGTLPSDRLVAYPGHSSVEFLPLCRDAVGVFYRNRRLGSVYSEAEFKGIEAKCTIFTINSRYSHVRNRHKMFITIEHIKNIGISKFENT